MDRELASEGESCSGLCHPTRRLLEVSTQGCLGWLQSVLLHEVMHACVAANGGHWPADEEFGVRLLEVPILSLFQDRRNDPVVRWLRCAG